MELCHENGALQGPLCQGRAARPAHRSRHNCRAAQPQEPGQSALPLARTGPPRSSLGCWLSRRKDFCVWIDISYMYILAMFQLIHDLSVCSEVAVSLPQNRT